MLKNHFARIKLGYGKTFPSSTHSIVYSCLPPDRLCTRDEFVNLVIQNPEGRETFSDKKGINNFVDELVKLGFIKEISGSVIETKLGL